MSEELKPCPFCGADAAIAYSFKAVISCTECPATITIDLHPGLFLTNEAQERRERKNAVEAWNRRNAMKEGE